MDIQRLHEAEFDQLQHDWNDLLAHSAADNVFLRWEWMHTWWEIFSDRRRLEIWAAREQGRLVGLAPFYVDHASFPRPRALKFCSDELSPDYLDLIIEKGLEADLAPRLLDSVLKKSGSWDVLELNHVLPDAVLLQHRSAFQAFSPRVETALPCPYITISGSFDAYYASHRALRNFHLERKQRDLNTVMTVVYRRVSDESAREKGLRDLFAMHETRAREKGIHSNFIPPKVQRFHQRLSALFLKAGFLRLNCLYEGDTPVSAAYAYDYRNKIYYFQTGFNPKYGKWSAGLLALKILVQQAFEEKRDEVDLLKGNESYKDLWATGVRQEQRLIAYNRTLRGQIARIGEILRTLLRPWKRRLLARKK